MPEAWQKISGVSKPFYRTIGPTRALAVVKPVDEYFFVSVWLSNIQHAFSTTIIFGQFPLYQGRPLPSFPIPSKTSL